MSAEFFDPTALTPTQDNISAILLNHLSATGIIAALGVPVINRQPVCFLTGVSKAKQPARVARETREAHG